jgi:hypothetical protein
MKGMRRLLKRFFLLVASGAASLFLAACYGPPMLLKDLRSMIRIRAASATFSGIEGIENIEVTAEWLETPVRTDSEGYALLSTADLGSGISHATVTLSDTDGRDNGEFKTKSEEIDLNDSLTTITLDPI